MKRASSSLTAHIMKILFWLLMLAGAIIVFVRLISRLPNEIPTTPQTPISGDNILTPTVTTEGETPQSPVSSTSAPNIGNSSVLFNEDFEDGRAQGFYYISGNWEIKEDDTGNKYYEIDNTGVSGFSSKLKFGSTSWKDYEIQIRVKMLNLIGNAVPQFLVYFKFNDNNSSSGYALNLQPSSEVADLVSVVSGQWQNEISRQYQYSTNTWYDIRIVAQETQIQVYINNKLIADGDAQAKSGNIDIDIGPGAKIQLDDIKVISIEK